MAGLVKKAQGLQRFMLDCGFWRSRKWVGAELAAIGLQACGISYSYEHGTDGRLPKDDLALALGLREKEVRNAVTTLLKRGIWTDVGDAFEIVGYGDHNPLQAEVDEHRERLAQNGIKGNHEKWHRSKPNPDCPFCRSPKESPRRSPTDPQPDRPSDRQAIANGSQGRSLSRVEESSTPPPPPLAVVIDPPIGTAGPNGEEGQNLEPPPDPPDHPMLEPLAERMAEGLWPGRVRMRAESRVSIRRCLVVADPSIVDEAIGTMLTVDDKPHTPKYLEHVVRNRLVSMGAYAPGDEALAGLAGGS